MRHPKRMATDPEPPARPGGDAMMGDEESVAGRIRCIPWSDAVAAAERVQRDEPVIRRQARPWLRMHGTAQIAEHDPSGRL